MTKPPELEGVRILRLEPGDVLVLRAERRVSVAEANQLRERMESVFPGHKSLVLDGVTLEVARPGSPTWEAECEEFGCTDPDHSSR